MNTVLFFGLWLTLIPVKLTTYVIKWPLAPIAVQFFTTEDGKHLDTPLEWFDTKDNDLCGDSGWKTEHIEPDSDPCSDWNKIRWLWRNGGNKFDYDVLGIDYDPAMGTDHYPDTYGFKTREDGYWRYRNIFVLDFPPFNGDKQLELLWGWSIYGNVEGRSKFVFTTRIQNAWK